MENELVLNFTVLCQEMTAKIKKKNADYSRGDDPFKNFRRHGPYGIVVRMDDKLSRLDSLLKPGSDGVAQVKDESVEDTAMDLAAYALLLILTRRAMKEPIKEAVDKILTRRAMKEPIKEAVDEMLTTTAFGRMP